MESVRACKSCSLSADQLARQPFLEALHRREREANALASLHVYGPVSDIHAFQPDRKRVIGECPRESFRESLRHGPFTFLFHVSISYSPLFSVVRLHSSGTFYAPCYTFTYVRNVCKWRTWGEAAATGVRFPFAQHDSWKFYSWFPGKEEIRGSFLFPREGRGTTSMAPLEK